MPAERLHVPFWLVQAVLPHHAPAWVLQPGSVASGLTAARLASHHVHLAGVLYASCGWQTFARLCRPCALCKACTMNA